MHINSQLCYIQIFNSLPFKMGKAPKHESFIDHRRRVQDERRAQRDKMALIKAANKQTNKQNFADRRKIAVTKNNVGKGIVGFTNALGKGLTGIANSKAANTAASKFFGRGTDIAKALRGK
jgi:hypothetical protein